MVQVHNPFRYKRPFLKRILKATATIGGMNMISRMLGFVRDMVIHRTTTKKP